MKRLVHLAAMCSLLALVSFPDEAIAADPSEVTFEAVDMVRSDGLFADVEGLVQGESTPRKIQFSFGSDEKREICEKYALMALSKPGRFLVTFERFSSSDVHRCSLTRR